MKRLIALLAVILLLPVLTACNREQTHPCRECGASIPNEDLFCRSCGASVAAPDTQPAANTEPVIEETQPSETAHKHSYLKTTISATCTENGYDSYDCICGESYTTNRVPPEGTTMWPVPHRPPV